MIDRFEAAWSGDLNTIKSMTLDMWGPEKQFFPLEICVKDEDDLSPFNIAVLRGHIGLARSIMSISKAQYKPEEKETEERFTLDIGDKDVSDYDSDSDLGGDDTSDEIRVRRHIIDDRFTIENVGEIKTQVESRVKPRDILNQKCPAHAFIEKEKLQGEQPQGVVEYAICKDDPKLLKFLLELGKELSANSSHDTGCSIYSIPEKTFQMAMRLGRLGCLKELIRCVGTGIPLDKLVERSGVVAQEKPIYYQGLSIHGEKRADWAAESRGVVITQPQDRHPPLLLAAYQGNLETVEWFLGTAPGRYYEHFVQTNKHEKQVEKLAQTPGGVVHSITNWLTSRRMLLLLILKFSVIWTTNFLTGDLVLHCAIMSNPTDESIRLVKYLVGQMPHCISVKSVEGYTPLALAFYLHRVEFAKILIQAGADQTTRDQHGRNLLHLLFFNTPGSPKNLEIFQQMLDLVDPLLVPSMLVERSSLHPGSVTPFSQWMNSQWLEQSSWRYHGVNEESKAKLAIVRKILDFAQGTGQKHLEVLNGAGNSVVHDAVRFQVPKTLGLMLEHRPELLHLENATGSTPKELAETAWVSDVTKDPPSLDSNRHNYNYHSRECVACRSPESFVEENLEAKDEKLHSRGVYEACRDWACKEQTSKKRKLVTLFDANEVAKRLAAQNTWKTNWNGSRRLQNAADKEMDEVLALLGSTRVD
jgi:ankyrin repeat protein